jgi:hypothetical protein
MLLFCEGLMPATHRFRQFDQIQNTLGIAHNQSLTIGRPLQAVQSVVTDMFSGNRYLDIGVQVPQTHFARCVNGCKHCRMFGRPEEAHDNVTQCY